MRNSVSTAVVDHHPSVLKSIFPVEAVSNLYDYYDFLTSEDIKKILGNKRMQEFEKGLIHNAFPFTKELPMHTWDKALKYFWRMLREEFHNPVLSLWFYKDLEEIQSERNKSALKAHGFSHGVLEALSHPEYSHLLRRVIEMIDDIILTDNPKEAMVSVKNNQSIFISLLPIEEIKATYLRDLFLADRQRKSKLLEFKNMNLAEMDEVQLKYNWAYVTAAKSFSYLRELGFRKSEIEGIIGMCNAWVNVFEIRETENWNPDEDKYLSNLPFFLTVLDKAEKIAGEDLKERVEKVKEIISDTASTSCFEISPFIHVPKLKIEKTKGATTWKTWKLEHTLGAVEEGELSEAALFDLSDVIVSSLIVSRGRINELEYQVLIPKLSRYKKQIHKIVMKIKLLLLKINPAFDYEASTAGGYVIKAREDFVFPKIISKSESEIKERLQEEKDYCYELEKELEEYAKISKLRKRMESALNLLSSPKHPLREIPFFK